MHPSGNTRPTPASDGVFVQTTAPLSEDVLSLYTGISLRVGGPRL